MVRRLMFRLLRTVRCPVHGHHQEIEFKSEEVNQWS